jgi:hypothetical protein
MASRFRPFGRALSWPSAFASPLGIALLGGSLLLAAIMAVRGAQATAAELVVWGALAYGAAVALHIRARRHPISRLAPVPAREPDLKPLVMPSVEEADEFEELVEEALRGLNEVSRLAKCGLAQRVPRTLVAALRKQGEKIGAEETSLNAARQLRTVIVEAIERLKPVEAEGTAQALQYHVLREEYVLGRTITAIALNHSVSEQTVFRRRREAIEALAVDIRQREASLARERPPNDPTAMDYLG